MKEWVDFRAVKQAVSFEQVLAHYDLTFTGSGRELRGRCPFHTDRKPSMRVNLDKKVFHCFGCQAKGNILDFVAALEEVPLREAALRLQELFQVESEAATQAQVAAGPPETSAGDTPNPPLAFQLKGIVSDHPYLRKRGITPETAGEFGVGFFPGKGSMAGRVVIPIHDEAGQLVAYAGRAIDDTEPRYKLPAKFQKSRVLFNLHRVLASIGTPSGTNPVTPIFIVEGFFDCMKMAQAGFSSTVALMGCALAPEQGRLLEPFREVALVLDGDEAGQRAAEELVGRLSRTHYVRVVDLPGQPDELSSEELRRRLSF